MARVSIIIPTYNRISFLRKTLQSVIDQDFNEWEVIIVDDSSDVKNITFYEEIIEKDSRFKLYVKNHKFEPKGSQYSRNKGLELATSNLIIFLDSDDILLPHCLQQRVTFMESNPSVEMAVFPGFRFWIKEDKKNLIGGNFTSSTEKASSLDRFFTDNGIWVNLSPIWKKESLMNKRISWDINVKQLQDWDFHIQAVCKGIEPVFLSNYEPDFLWIFHDEPRISKAKNDNLILDSKIKMFFKSYQTIRQAGLLTTFVGRKIKKNILSLSFRLLDNGFKTEANIVWNKLRKLPMTSNWEIIIGFCLILIYKIVLKLGLR